MKSSARVIRAISMAFDKCQRELENNPREEFSKLEVDGIIHKLRLDVVDAVWKALEE